MNEKHAYWFKLMLLEHFDGQVIIYAKDNI
jgi:hypothetical protein